MIGNKLCCFISGKRYIYRFSDYAILPIKMCTLIQKLKCVYV